MNRAIVIVKNFHKAPEKFSVIRIHHNYGQPLEDWLRTEYGTWYKAYDLICQGHRSTIETPHREPGNLPEHECFTRLRDAKSWCEYLSLAYHDGKKWKFEHREV